MQALPVIFASDECFCYASSTSLRMPQDKAKYFEAVLE
jgi:hypothetical protein